MRKARQISKYWSKLARVWMGRRDCCEGQILCSVTTDRFRSIVVPKGMEAQGGEKTFVALSLSGGDLLASPQPLTYSYPEIKDWSHLFILEENLDIVAPCLSCFVLSRWHVSVWEAVCFSLLHCVVLEPGPYMGGSSSTCGWANRPFSGVWYQGAHHFCSPKSYLSSLT